MTDFSRLNQNSGHGIKFSIGRIERPERKVMIYHEFLAASALVFGPPNLYKNVRVDRESSIALEHRGNEQKQEDFPPSLVRM